MLPASFTNQLHRRVIVTDCLEELPEDISRAYLQARGVDARVAAYVLAL